MTAAAFPQPLRPHHAGFWPAYLVTMRPYLLFVSGITGIVGLSLVDHVPWTTLLVLGSAFFLSYGFGQALTDCFQTDTDALSSPYRPLVRGLIGRHDVLLVSLLGLGSVGIALTAYNPMNAGLAAVAVIGLATYTWFKRRWWGGPWYNAWIVAALVVMGYLGAAGDGMAPVSADLIAAMAVALFAYANFVLAGYFKDIDADRATGYRTLPVVYGRRRSAWASDALAAAAVIAAMPTVLQTEYPALVLAFIVPATVSSIVAQVRLHRVRADDQAYHAIRPVVHTYVLLLSGLCVAHQPSWAWWLGPFALLYGWAMHRRPLATQI